VRDIVKTIISEENTERDPHIMAPAVVKVRNVQEEEITHLHEDEHLMIQKPSGEGTLDFVNSNRTRYD